MVEIPLVASYRLQLTPSFDLDDAARLVPYLAALGISHVYTSSYLQAAPGSTHGYDVVDPTAVNVELGGEDALLRFHQALEQHGLGNIVDVVPNHMAVGGPENRLWWDVLKCGQRSPAARYFDIDWDPPEAKLAGRILLPVLGGSYADELAGGGLRLERSDCGPEIHYAEHRFPIDPETLSAEEAANLERFEDRQLLHELLERQHYRLASWTVGRYELNYRRFFEVNTLAGVRVEDPAIFDAVHRRTLQWFEQGRVQGLRIDHPDGLRDPGGYLHRLRKAAPEAWIVVEKILEPGESLPGDWPVDGTTGYDFVQNLTAVFVPPEAEATMTETYAAVTGSRQPYADVLRDCKAFAVRELLATEVTRLTRLASRICERSVVGRDVSRRTVQAALEAILVATPVYRTYVVDGHASAADSVVITETIAAAKAAEPTIEGAVFDFLGGVWAGRHVDMDTAEFVARLQQLSGPAMAKGAEDTAFYRYHRLVALNEVGSDPARFGISIDDFHAAQVAAAARLPRSMIATSTHDTKRSEDVRARIALLAELPDVWRAVVLAWSGSNAAKWGDAEPDLNVEYLLYQTLVGAHPLPVARAVEFATKAMREAKMHTSWLRPDEAYEARVVAFIRALDADPVFQGSLAGFVARLVRPGRIAGLAQTLIKATAPGIPDFYQGSELWTASLVDPDNRTEVDYQLRRRLLAKSDGDDPTALADDVSGETKLALVRAALRVRRDRAGAFGGPGADYEPLKLRGERAGAGLAFVRGGQVLTIAAVRPVAIDREGWGDTTIDLPSGRWTCALRTTVSPASGTVAISDVMMDQAVALLVRENGR